MGRNVHSLIKEKSWRESGREWEEERMRKEQLSIARFWREMVSKMSELRRVFGRAQTGGARGLHVAAHAGGQTEGQPVAARLTTGQTRPGQTRSDQI